MVADLMDLDALLTWRAVSTNTYAVATTSLRHTLIGILRKFLSNPRTFLNHITETKAVVAGPTAVAFMLRDVTAVPSILHVYAATFWYGRLVERLRTCWELFPDVARIVSQNMDVPYSVERDITASTAFYLRNGKTIIVYRSCHISPCSPISRMPSSALMTFFTEFTFGCAYPALTLRRRSLLSDMRLRTLSPDDEDQLTSLLRAGFSFAVSPTAWEEYRTTAAEPPRPNTHFCLRRRYLCPQQGRYFGDRGSLVGIMDPLSYDGSVIRSRSIPPFGPMVAWRLLNTYDCMEGCDMRDPLLHEWHISIPILTLPCPFFAHGPDPPRARHVPLHSSVPDGAHRPAKAGRRARSVG